MMRSRDGELRLLAAKPCSERRWKLVKKELQSPRPLQGFRQQWVHGMFSSLTQLCRWVRVVADIATLDVPVKVRKGARCV